MNQLQRDIQTLKAALKLKPRMVEYSAALNEMSYRAIYRGRKQDLKDAIKHHVGSAIKVNGFGQVYVYHFVYGALRWRRTDFVIHTPELQGTLLDAKKIVAWAQYLQHDPIAIRVGANVRLFDECDNATFKRPSVRFEWAERAVPVIKHFLEDGIIS